MRTLLVSFRMMIVMTMITGFLYAASVTMFAQAFMSDHANGSVVTTGDSTVRGSALIAQKFSDPRYFWPRPSAVDFNPQSSGASQLSISSAALRDAVKERQAQGATGSLQYASGSGLDPHIFPADAVAQIERIAKARALNSDQVTRLQDLVKSSIEGRQFGLLGEERVNVLILNMTLQQEFK